MYLFLNDVAGSEILLILVFILIFFGSKSIPGIARTVGRTMRQIQDASSDIQNEIKKTTSEYKKDLNLDGIFKEAAEDIKRPLDQMVDDLDNSIKYTPPKRTISPHQGTTENPVQPPSVPMEIPDEANVSKEDDGATDSSEDRQEESTK